MSDDRCDTVYSILLITLPYYRTRHYRTARGPFRGEATRAVCSGCVGAGTALSVCLVEGIDSFAMWPYSTTDSTLLTGGYSFGNSS